MKRRLITIMVIVIILVGISYYLYSKDNFRFKYSYEAINNQVLGNNQKIKVSIPLNNGVKYLDAKGLDEFLESGTGLLYFGYSTCPWCRNAVPVLVEAARNNNMNIYYVDIHSVKISNTKVYDKLDEYLRVDDEGNKVLAVPDVYTIKNGEVLDHHLGVIEEYTNPYAGMTESQKLQLQEIYDEMIKELKG